MTHAIAHTVPRAGLINGEFSTVVHNESHPGPGDGWPCDLHTGMSTPHLVTVGRATNPSRLDHRAVIHAMLPLSRASSGAVETRNMRKRCARSQSRMHPPPERSAPSSRRRAPARTVRRAMGSRRDGQCVSRETHQRNCCTPWRSAGSERRSGEPPQLRKNSTRRRNAATRRFHVKLPSAILRHRRHRRRHRSRNAAASAQMYPRATGARSCPTWRFDGGSATRRPCAQRADASYGPHAHR